MEPAQVLFSSPANSTASAPVMHHILSGSFRSISLFLLAFSPLQRTLSLVQTVDAFGPHQYLATNARKDRAYTTSWALPPVLSSWDIERDEAGNPWRVNLINSVPITATSSYITLPPPYTHIYSAGGPTGEVHTVDPSTGGFGDKLQQILFVPEDELGAADKTRAALRYGSHAVEFSPGSSHAFIPVLGTDTIETYTRDRTSGLLTHIAAIPSPRGPSAHDGPRHIKIHPNGKVLYCVTEHTNYIDTYKITPATLTYIASRSLLPPNTPRPARFRGDTLLLAPTHPSPRSIFATTRGSTVADKGYLSIFALDSDGLFSSYPPPQGEGEDGIERYETPTSGGKAHALDLLPKAAREDEGLWILLTDDDDSAAAAGGGGGVRVLEWEGWGKGGVKEVVGWPLPGEEVGGDGKERMKGGSHAVWLD